jgi:RNA polymerase sigma factor (sigma-70 family)
MKEISFRNDVLPLKNVLFRLALRITMNREEAEDVVQDTLLKVWNRRETLSEIDSIEAFSMTICRNIALDRTKRSSWRNESLDEQTFEPQVSAQATPYEKAEQRDMLNTVRQIIDSLPEKQKTCMQLRDFEGKAYKDIAAALSISEEQVKVNIYRARQAVKQKFNEKQEYGL